MSTATKNRKQAELHYVGRCQFKATGAILYGVRSGETVYHVTILAGKVTGCQDSATGECCNGFHYQGDCRHAKFVRTLEAQYIERQEQIAEAEVIAPMVLGPTFTQDLHEHIVDELSSQNDPVGWTESKQREWFNNNFNPNSYDAA